MKKSKWQPVKSELRREEVRTRLNTSEAVNASAVSSPVDIIHNFLIHNFLESVFGEIRSGMKNFIKRKG